MNRYTLFILATAVLASCTIQKRHHLPGYHIQFLKNSPKNTAQAPEIKRLDSAMVKELISESKATINPEDSLQESHERIHTLLEIAPAPKTKSKALKEVSPITSRQIAFVKQPATLMKSGDPIYYTEPRTHGLAIASLVCGIAGFIILPFLLPLLAIIFGAIAFLKITKSPEEFTGKGLAIAGIILGFCSLLLYGLLIYIIIAGII